MSLVIDETLKTIPWLEDRKVIKSAVRIKGLGSDSTYSSNETIVLDYFPPPHLSGRRFAKLRRDFHIVKGSECGFSLGMISYLWASLLILQDGKRKFASVRICFVNSGFHGKGLRFDHPKGEQQLLDPE